MDLSTIPSPYQHSNDVPEIFQDSLRSPSFVQLNFGSKQVVRTVTNAHVMDVKMPDLDDFREQEIIEKIERSKAKERAKKGRFFGGRRKDTQPKDPAKANEANSNNSSHFLDNLWSFGTGSGDMVKNMSDMTAYE